MLVNSIEFDSKMEACEYYNVSYSTVLDRARNKGITFEESLNISILGENRHKSNKSKSVKVKVGDDVFNSRKEACKYYNIKYHTICYHMQSKGISFIDALKYYINKKYDISDIEICEIVDPKVVVDGMGFDSNSSACEYFGFSYDSIMSLSREKGISVVRLLELWIKLKDCRDIVDTLNTKG